MGTGGGSCRDESHMEIGGLVAFDHLVPPGPAKQGRRLRRGWGVLWICMFLSS